MTSATSSEKNSGLDETDDLSSLDGQPEFSALVGQEPSFIQALLIARRAAQRIN